MALGVRLHVLPRQAGADTPHTLLLLLQAQAYGKCIASRLPEVSSKPLTCSPVPCGCCPLGSKQPY